jgi:hypothetical protein
MTAKAWPLEAVYVIEYAEVYARFARVPHTVPTQEGQAVQFDATKGLAS